MGFSITSPEALQLWLRRKPIEWADVVRFRQGLRSTFIAIRQNSQTISARSRREIFSDFRLLSIMYAWFLLGERNRELAEYRVLGALFQIKGSYANHALRGLSLNNANHDASKKIDSQWLQISKDCTQLDGGISPSTLLSNAIWDEPPSWFQEEWAQVAMHLSAPEGGFEIWREWCFGRMSGLPHAFANFDDTADRSFYTWIIRQENDWWEREPTDVNADIKAHVDKLRRPEPTDLPDLGTLAQQLAMVEASTQIVNADDIGDLKRATESVLEASKRAREELALPTIGHNSGTFEGHKLGSELTLPANAAEGIAEQIQGIDARLVALQKDLERSRLTKGELAEQGKGLVERLDKIRKISPEFFKGFESQLGKGLGIGLSAVLGLYFAKLSGLLKVILTAVSG